MIGLLFVHCDQCVCGRGCVVGIRYLHESLVHFNVSMWVRGGGGGATIYQWVIFPQTNIAYV